MSFYRALKSLVPLQWKVGFHKYKAVPDLALRVVNRLKGEPAIPPGELIYLVAAHRNTKAFLEGGHSASETIRRTLNKHGVDVSEFGHVLDFGCGVGRIMRHWNKVQGPTWHGTDYSAELVGWCQDHLTFSEFQTNTLSGNLPYESATFDFIYAFSVFTHLKESLQTHWINELSRVLQPGGYMYLTMHGDYYLSELTPEERDRFQSGQLVVREQEQSGSNLCAVFHPVGYVRENLARNLMVVDHIAGGANGDSMHDIYLLKKSA
jgi:SAM-dependent methyltransferase